MRQPSTNPEKRGTIVVLRHDPGMIGPSVTDNGKGFEVEENTSLPNSYSQGIGLIGMHERLELLGGPLEIDSEPGGSTQVTAYVPVREDESA